MSSRKAPITVNARPTKGFFIDMLTRDVLHIPAILDLVDNCIDGIHRTAREEDWHQYWIKITGGPDRLTIADNCGGIPINLAKDYAFRFGRDEDTPGVPGSIGTFGVGMKRALFKLGNRFRVRSEEKASRFVLDVNVPEWKRKTEWTFELTDYGENLAPDNRQLGTIIEIDDLHPEVSSLFGRTRFWKRLVDDLQYKHAENLRKGVDVTVNEHRLQHTTWQLLSSASLIPFRSRYVAKQYDPPVKVRAYAGVLDSDPAAAGWYVFCNGRMILRADRTLTTGWGEDGGGTIPRYHGQFARFRGYTFFESEEPINLPWNTTKTGVDAESPLYRGVRSKMVDAMRPVMDFLNELDAEIGKEERPVHALILHAKPTNIDDIYDSPKFDWNRQAAKKRPRTVNIQYEELRTRVERVQRTLGVSSAREAGRRTFNYYYERECRD